MIKGPHRQGVEVPNAGYQPGYRLEERNGFYVYKCIDVDGSVDPWTPGYENDIRTCNTSDSKYTEIGRKGGWVYRAAVPKSNSGATYAAGNKDAMCRQVEKTDPDPDPTPSKKKYCTNFGNGSPNQVPVGDKRIGIDCPYELREIGAKGCSCTCTENAGGSADWRCDVLTCDVVNKQLDEVLEAITLEDLVNDYRSRNEESANMYYI